MTATARAFETPKTRLPRPTWCGGAGFELTGPLLAELRRDGWDFRSGDSAGTGRHFARLACGGEITVRADGYRSALCPSCERAESEFRRMLRGRAGQ